MTQRVILVGADELSEVAQRFWRVVAIGNSKRSLLDPPNVPILSLPDLGIPYFLPEVLDRVLELVLQTAASKSGWLAIRAGDFFEIKAHQNCENCAGERISIDANPLLREIVKTRQARLVERGEIEWAMVPRTGFKKSPKIWAGLPLIIGQRLIGLFAFWRESLILPDEWSGLQQLCQKSRSVSRSEHYLFRPDSSSRPHGSFERFCSDHNFSS